LLASHVNPAEISGRWKVFNALLSLLLRETVFSCAHAQGLSQEERAVYDGLAVVEKVCLCSSPSFLIPRESSKSSFLLALYSQRFAQENLFSSLTTTIVVINVSRSSFLYFSYARRTSFSPKSVHDVCPLPFPSSTRLSLLTPAISITNPHALADAITAEWEQLSTEQKAIYEKVLFKFSF
jgi:hypothetical protein